MHGVHGILYILVISMGAAGVGGFFGMLGPFMGSVVGATTIIAGSSVWWLTKVIFQGGGAD